MKKLTEIQIHEEAEFMVMILPKMIACIKQIKKTKEKNHIEMYIDALEKLEEITCRVIDMPYTSIKRKIREGRGDYGKIQKKCIKMGVV